MDECIWVFLPEINFTYFTLYIYIDGGPLIDLRQIYQVT